MITIFTYRLDDWETWSRDNLQCQAMGAGRMPSRRYGYAMAPSYLNVTIWMFASDGIRLRSDRFTPSAEIRRHMYDGSKRGPDAAVLPPVTFQDRLPNFRHDGSLFLVSAIPMRS